MLLIGAPSLAVAQNVLKFSGFVQNGPALSGTITVDASSGLIIAADIKVFGQQPADLNQIASQRSLGFAYVFALTPSNPACPRLIIGERSAPQSLAAYQGGPIGPRSVFIGCDGAQKKVLGGMSLGS